MLEHTHAQVSGHTCLIKIHGRWMRNWSSTSKHGGSLNVRGSRLCKNFASLGHQSGKCVLHSTLLWTQCLYFIFYTLYFIHDSIFQIFWEICPLPVKMITKGNLSSTSRYHFFQGKTFHNFSYTLYFMLYTLYFMFYTFWLMEHLWSMNYLIKYKYSVARKFLFREELVILRLRLFIPLEFIKSENHSAFIKHSRVHGNAE